MYAWLPSGAHYGWLLPTSRLIDGRHVIGAVEAEKVPPAFRLRRHISRGLR